MEALLFVIFAYILHRIIISLYYVPLGEYEDMENDRDRLLAEKGY